MERRGFRWRDAGQGTIARVILGSVLGILALWLATRRVDWGLLRESLRGIRYEFAVLALLINLATLPAQAVRWRILFYPDDRHLPMTPLFKGVVLAQMLNILVPARLGEVARVYALGTQPNIGRIRILSTIVVEKVLDLCAVAASVTLLLFAVSLPGWLRDSGRVLLAGSALILAAGFILLRRGDKLTGWCERQAAKLSGRWGEVLSRLGRSTLDGFSALRHTHSNIRLWTITIVIMLLAAATNYVLFLAFGFRLPLTAALFLLIVLQVGVAPPSLPGKIGVFNYLVVLGLSVYSIDGSVAFSYSIVLYAVAFLPKIILGSVILAIPHKSYAVGHE
ncbi:MAG TPA: lysylphosphatidylglycerol synthase transmembrane domain-containing protein [Acidobacteriota bacterium]|nr:lysylphosphatidylglycerol synthase transmembrane domain-containing protein [Acidobacteriota bacterium]